MNSPHLFLFYDAFFTSFNIKLSHYIQIILVVNPSACSGLTLSPVERVKPKIRELRKSIFRSLDYIDSKKDYIDFYLFSMYF
jgi:hypothetical protein